MRRSILGRVRCMALFVLVRRGVRTRDPLSADGRCVVSDDEGRLAAALATDADLLHQRSIGPGLVQAFRMVYGAHDPSVRWDGPLRPDDV